MQKEEFFVRVFHRVRFCGVKIRHFKKIEAENYPYLCRHETAFKEQSGTIVALYPNPTTGTVHIEAENLTKAQVFHTMGQQVKTVQNTNEVSLEGLPQGVYLMRVTLEGGKAFSDKVMKE
ncbi:MAG: T9SS type A sorting domain-containing protein [Bacteroidales bacterium]|nr:T9SS type A sorting domain-containing protein [Bacteroidales bacterium]